MFKKIFLCAMIFVLMISSGCGEEKVFGTPDKAVLAYAEIITTGESANLEAAGFTDDDIKNLRKMIIDVFAETFKGVAPLSEATSDEISKIFYDNSKAKMNFSAKIKTDDKDHPVVELTTTPLDVSKSGGKTNDKLIALIGMVGKLKSEGATDEQLKENPDVQKLAVTAIGKYINEIPVQEQKTFEVPCVKVPGTDGRIHWAPSDGKELMEFLIGKK